MEKGVSQPLNPKKTWLTLTLSVNIVLQKSLHGIDEFALTHPTTPVLGGRGRVKSKYGQKKEDMQKQKDWEL